MQSYYVDQNMNTNKLQISSDLRWRNTVENEHFHFFSLSYHYENIAESLI